MPKHLKVALSNGHYCTVYLRGKEKSRQVREGVKLLELVIILVQVLSDTFDLIIKKR